MSKDYLEALKIGIPKLKKLYENNAKKMSSNDILGFDLTFSYLDKVLAELEAIDSVNSSEALNELEELLLSTYSYIIILDRLNSAYPIIKKALLKAQEEKQILDILKANIVDSSVHFGSDFDSENRISLTIEIYQCKDYIDKTTGNKEIAVFKNKNFDLILDWLKEKYNNV